MGYFRVSLKSLAFQNVAKCPSEFRLHGNEKNVFLLVCTYPRLEKEALDTATEKAQLK